MDEKEKASQEGKWDFNDHFKDKKKEKRPSLLLEFIIAAVLFIITITGMFQILNAFLEGSFNSIFGMGLK